MELLEYWRTLKSRLWLIALLAILGAAGGFYYVRQQVPLYTTSTTLYLNPVSPSPLLPYQTETTAQSLANTYVEFMKTRSFASLVVEELPYELAQGTVLDALSTQLLPGTQFFRIAATHPNPEVAQALANTAAEVLMAENVRRQVAQREQLEAQRDPAKILERQRLTQLQETITEELDYTDDRVTSLSDLLVTLEARPPSEELDQQILDVREEILRYQTLRVELFGSLAQAESALASMEEMSNALVDTAVVVDPAPLPTSPRSKELARYLLMGFVAGAGAGVALAFLFEYIDYTVKTPTELDALYGLSTLGVIGAFRRENGNESDDKENNDKAATLPDLVTVHRPHSPVSEAFRAIRTNLQFARPGEPIRSLLITSAGPAEGKTLISANLAVILAQAGQRVILVDADLRRPRLHRVFGLPSAGGLTDLIAEPNGDVRPYLKSTVDNHLRLVTCGGLPRNPAELLGSARTAQVMAQLARLADIVIYDSPPLAGVTDAAVLGSRVDAVIQVVRAHGPRRDLVLRGKETLNKVGASLLGPVLNRVEASDLGYYAYYYYYGYDPRGGERENPSWWQRWRRRKSRRSWPGDHQPGDDPGRGPA